MVDSIIGCNMYKNLNGTISGYEVTFSYDGLTIPEKYNPVYVMVGSLTNPTDLNEVKKVACQQAKDIKALYLNPIIITDLNGPVVL